MNASLDVNRDVAPVPPTLGDRFAVVREMLSDLDHITVAGQHHVMSKIIRFVETEASLALRDTRARNRMAFTELLAGLRHESGRLSPDVASFARSAEAVSSLLAALA